MHYDTIIVGGGPAGLFVAQELGRTQKNVLLLERNKSAGRKLSISGAGQCNFTHDGNIDHFLQHYGDNFKFMRKSLDAFDSKSTIKFFERQGITHTIFPNGKVFPKSMKSKDILNALLIKCQKNNVQILYNKLVTGIETYDKIFVIDTEDENRYLCDNVIIATGGKSYPKTGSDGMGYTFAESFGHKIIEPRPALTDVRISNFGFKDLSGISVQDVKVTIWHNNKKVKDYTGDLLFTHKGLSGPAIINSSRWMKNGDTICINFLNPKTHEEIKNFFSSTMASRGKEEVITFLRQFGLPKALNQLLCKGIKLGEHSACAEVNKKQREALVDSLTRCSFIIDSLGGFHLAMVTAGGVSLKDINPTTMESRKQKGLYFIGEVLDVDGDTGGYNIQAAFSMGMTCANHIAKNHSSLK